MTKNSKPSFFAPSQHRLLAVTASNNANVLWQAQADEFNTSVLKTINERVSFGYVFRVSLHDGTPWGCGEFQTNTVHNTEGHYVGDHKFAEYLISQGIRAEKASPDHSVCSIGFSNKHNSWYGWSHRATCGFTIGDRVFIENFGDGETLFKQHGPELITHIDMAKQAAINFANYVS